MPLFPAVAFVVIGLFGDRMKKLEWGGWVAVGASFLALAVGVVIAVGEMLNPGTFTSVSFTWFQVPFLDQTYFPGGFKLVIGTLVSPIAALMLLVVNIVGALVMLYSIGYMHRDGGLARYYAILSLFLVAMNGVVLSNNLFEFFLFWELVGVCSYFLIGFYYEKPSASSAAKEAFLVTRVGDVLFLLGIFIYFVYYAGAQPAGAATWAASGFVFTNGNVPFLAPFNANPTDPLLTVAGLMMLAGAAGKSAQFPLDVWLPDAMEGPTTVSALIHAATMVAAGVFLLATVSVYIGFTSIDLVAIAVVGAVTLIYAASMAMVQSDIKRVIAFSTVSQLGYMVLVIGAGFSMVGLYHLFTHAFFKALLFLAAGSVIHAVATQNMFQMGGLRKPMRVTATAFVIGGLALTGVPPFAGFFSKDDVLTSVYDQAQTAGHAYLWPLLGVAVATVFLTGYYIFRAYYLTFSGDRPRDPTIAHVHESPWSMRVPLLVLSGFAIVAGLLVYWPTFATLFDMGAGVPAPIDALDIDLSSLWTVVGVAGIVVAWRMWGNGRVYTLPADSAAQGVRRVLLRRYYLKEAYDWFGLRAVYALARFTEFVDTYVVDGTIRGLERMFSAASGRLRRLQSGVVSDYAAYVATGLVAGLLFLVFVGPYLAKMFGGG